LVFIAFLFNKSSKSNIAFLFFSLSTGLWILSLFFLYYSADPFNELISDISVKLAYGFSLLMTMSFVIFMYFFPKQTIKFSDRTKLIYISLNIIVVLLSVFTSLIYKEQILVDGIYQFDKLGNFYFLYVLFILTNFIIVMSLAIQKISKLSGIDKKKLQIVIAAFGSFGFFAILINVILPIFDIYFFQKIIVLFTLIFLIPTFYSIHKHRFFNTSYLTLELLRNLIILSIFIIFTVFVNHSLLVILNNNYNVLIFIISILSGLFIWVKIQKYLPKLILSEFGNFKNNIEKLIVTFSVCSKYSELENILEKYFIIKLNISNAKLYITRNTPVDSNLAIYIKDEFTNELKKHKNDVLVKSELEYMKIDKNSKKILLNKMTDLDAELCMPLFAEHKLIGFFILGSKEKNKLYTKEEINQILKIKSPMEIAITNFLIKLNLQEENNLMKEIIEDKTKKLKNQFNEIKTLLEQQSDFIAVTAHEFRTPLSIAMFQLEDTLTAHRHTPQVVKDMEVMSESLNNLKNLTQKLFDVQQYDLNKIKLNKETINLNDFLNKIYQEFKIIIEEKNIDFKFKNKIDKNKEIEIDKYQIRQVLTNLLNNAIKFADKNNPQITIELKEKNNSVQIAVIDNGEGVSDKDKKRVFEKFQTTKASKGTGIGLGLYLCKKIIELHKGEIWIDNNEDSGTKFIFELRK
jgi:signal transduction histidine kinase